MTEESKDRKSETTIDQSNLNGVLSAAVALLDGRNWHELSNKENTLLLKLEAIGKLKARNGFITKTGTEVSGQIAAKGYDPLFPTRGEIEQMGRINHILNRAIRMAGAEKLNWVETLHFAVKCLVEHSNIQQEQMVKMAELKCDTLIIKEGS